MRGQNERSRYVREYLYKRFGSSSSLHINLRSLGEIGLLRPLQWRRNIGPFELLAKYRRAGPEGPKLVAPLAFMRNGFADVRAPAHHGRAYRDMAFPNHRNDCARGNDSSKAACKPREETS